MANITFDFAAEGPQAMTRRNPASAAKAWPRFVILLLILAGLISPIVCFAAAAVVFALSDQDDGILLSGAGLTHLVLTWTLFAGV